jgi:hypothetical protein
MYHFIRKANVIIPDALLLITLHSGNNILFENSQFISSLEKENCKINHNINFWLSYRMIAFYANNF